MPLINTSVPNLIQGVSQQSDAIKFDGQCEEQENALSSVVEGLKKRPNTSHISKLLNIAISSKSFTHFIDRSKDEKYVVIHTGSVLRAWNLLTGQAATINGSLGGIPTSSTYLETTTPKTILKALTVADTTFLLNTVKTVSASNSFTPPLEKRAAVNILQGGYDKKYEVKVTITSSTDEPSAPNYIAPQFTVNTTPFVYDKEVERGDAEDNEPDEITYYIRHRITSINIVSGGQSVPNDFGISVSSSTTERAPASFSFNVSNGVVVGASVANQGAYDGTGERRRINTSSYDEYYEIGYLPPTFSVVTSGSSQSIANTLTASITSGNSAGGGSNTNANTDEIASELLTEMSSQGFGAYFNLQRQGNTILLLLTYSEAGKEFDFTVTTTDSLADTGINSVYKTTEAISDLPTTNLNGFRVKVRGDIDSAQDDYYVRFETKNGASFGEGIYVEDIAPEVSKGLNASTMPHSLINSGLNEFKFQETLFLDRVAGDDETNPLPTFVNNLINGMFFFKNRLGFLSGNNVVMTESGLGTLNDQGIMQYNLGRVSVTSFLDSANIDISVSSGQVTQLVAAEAFQEDLVLFADNGQFVLKGGEILTAKTVNVTPITNFDYDTAVEPLPLGSYIYFPFNRGNYTGLREFTVNSSTDTYDAVEITEHVPSYIPTNIKGLIGSTSEDMIAILSNNSKGSLYIYTYFWSGNQKVLSAWSRFTVKGEIIAATFFKSSLYLVITDNGETNLAQMNLESGLKDPEGYTTNLDMRVSVSLAQGEDTFELPYEATPDSIQVYTKDGLFLDSDNSGTTVTLKRPVTENTEVWAGIPYTMRYTFSQQLFKAKVGNGRSPSNAAKLLVRNGSVYYEDSAYFQVKVTPKFRKTYVNTFTPTVVGESIIGELTLDSGFYKFPIFTQATDATITIENDSALPSTFQSAEFESFVYSRSTRYG